MSFLKISSSLSKSRLALTHFNPFGRSRFRKLDLSAQKPSGAQTWATKRPEHRRKRETPRRYLVNIGETRFRFSEYPRQPRRSLSVIRLRENF